MCNEVEMHLFKMSPEFRGISSIHRQVYPLDSGRKFKSKIIFQSKGNENSAPLKFPAFQASFFCLFITGVVSLNCDDWFGQHPLEVLPRTLSNNNKHRPRLLTTHTQKYI